MFYGQDPSRSVHRQYSVVHDAYNPKTPFIYRNAPNVFSIDGDDEDEDDRGGASSGGGFSSEDEVGRETVSLETWLNKPDVKHAFKCEQVYCAARSSRVWRRSRSQETEAILNISFFFPALSVLGMLH